MMVIKLLYIIALLLPISLFSNEVVIKISPPKGGGDATEIVRCALENAPKKGVKVVFEQGLYNFTINHAVGKYHSITNHANGYKYIALNIEGFEDIEIDGQGSMFIFHGMMLPVLIEKSYNVKLKNLTIDWEIPFFIQGTVVGFSDREGWYDLKIDSQGYSWKVEAGRLKFPVDQNYTYSSVGESLVFDSSSRGPIYNSGELDIHRKNDVVAMQHPNGVVRITEKLKLYPPIGSVMTYKGPMGENRYAPAIHAINSKQILVHNVTVNHALGMGFLGERSGDITLNRFDVVVPKGSSRMISATADATHFCNCTGSVLIDSCRFENMLDDGTNVHGTYLDVLSVVSPNKIQARLYHFQQSDFDFADEGDEVWFLIAPNSSRSNENIVTEIKKINDLLCEITLKNPLPKTLKKGDAIENKTRNTSSFIFRNSIVQNNRARNIVLKAPGRVVVENNYFQSMMPSILVRGEMSFWYESGASENIVIRNNRFENCVLGGGNQAVIHIQPRLNKRFDSKKLFDKNIVIENNEFNTFDRQIVYAESVENLTIRDNIIVETSDYKPFFPHRGLLTIRDCSGVIIEGNSYDGEAKNIIDIDKSSSKDAKVE